MKLHRILCALVAVALLAGCVRRNNDDPAAGMTTLIYGSPLPLTGSLFPGWEAGAGDSAAAALLRGYETVADGADGRGILNPIAVESCQTDEGSDGTRSYIFTLRQRLCYNTGEEITAVDYVFALLYAASPAAAVIGAQYADGSALAGYWRYRSGESAVFSGVRLLDEYSFLLTVAAQSLPCNDALALVRVFPLPVQVIAPGTTVCDDGAGAYLSEPLTGELLRQTVLDPTTGYRYAPAVTSGPYQFSSRADTGFVLTRNTRFTQEWDGAAPTISRLVFQNTGGDSMKKLASGEVDILCGITDGEAIAAGLALVQDGNADSASYPRCGLGRLLIRCDGAAGDVRVRQALACCLDRDTLARRYTGGYGAPVNGLYGLGSPEYAALELELAALDGYLYDPDRARELLAEAGIETPLRLTLGTTGNEVSALLSSLLLPAAAGVGIVIEERVMDFAALRASLYGEDDAARCDLYCTALDLEAFPEYWRMYSTDAGAIGVTNLNRLLSPELAADALALRRTDAADRERWLSRWFTFQKRYNELLPDIPLYSDLCYDFFSPALQNYQPDALRGFAYAVVRAQIG